MRDIKFRKWILGEMDYSPDIWADGEGGVLVNYYFGNEEDGIWMQYTGLKDKNGVEIYEGDLVTIPQWNENKRKVYFCSGMFKVENGLSGFSLTTTQGEVQCIVVGNIYEGIKEEL